MVSKLSQFNASIVLIAFVAMIIAIVESVAVTVIVAKH